MKRISIASLFAGSLASLFLLGAAAHADGGITVQPGTYTLEGDEVCRTVVVSAANDWLGVCLLDKDSDPSNLSYTCFSQANPVPNKQGEIILSSKPHYDHDAIFGLPNEVQESSLSIKLDSQGKLTQVKYYSRRDDIDIGYPVLRAIELVGKPFGLDTSRCTRSDG